MRFVVVLIAHLTLCHLSIMASFTRILFFSGDEFLGFFFFALKFLIFFSVVEFTEIDSLTLLAAQFFGG
jgi:hypothetical protein